MTFKFGRARKAQRLIRWNPPWHFREFRFWLYYQWSVTPLIDGYERLGTGLRGRRILGFEVDYV